MVLPQSFFNRPTVVVAQELLGKFLVRRVGKREVAAMIIETEAYDGFKDKASHAHWGQTARNSIMFGKPGHIYAYFTYGMHWMLNIVTGEKGYPAAGLIRGAQIINENKVNFQRREALISRPRLAEEHLAEEGLSING